ncbi:putative chaperone protein, partial [Reticulomyxa filosa]
MYHDGAGDNHPDDTKRDHNVVLRALQKKRNLRYYIGKLNDSLNKMIRVFKKTGYEMNLIVEEHEMPDVKNLFESVVRSVTDAINAIRVSKKRELIFMFFFLGVAFYNNFDNKKNGQAKENRCIDFGTDGTGVAYSFSDGKVYTKKWPGRMLAEKNKTNLLLDKDGNFVAFGQEATDRYTSSVDSSLEFYERFKMALYNNMPDEIGDGKYDDDTKEQDLEPYLIAANGKKRKTLDVLKQVFTFLRESIMKILRDSTLVEKIEEVQWVVTVPAIWSNTAKNSMREAALLAGLISDSISDHLLIAFEPGDKYILLDLGGGTADIACHRVLDEKSVSQIYAPSGGPWGSTYIDDAFWGLLCEIFGREIMEEFKTKYSNEHVQLIENFRLAKHSYNPTSPDTPKIKVGNMISFMKTHKVSLEDIGKK